MAEAVDAPQGGNAPAASSQEVYNLVTDVVAGPNLRLRDNFFQALAIFVFTLLGAAIGALAFPDSRGPAAIGGALVGLLAGLFLSGIFLMIFRFVQHARGKHR
jgi:membrane associated rhomboid family serine protease